MYGIDALKRHLRQFQPDVHVADLEQVDSRLLTRAPELDEEEAAVNVVALIDEPHPNWARRALRAGVKSILNRGAPAEDILRCIQSAFSGMVTLEPELVRGLLTGIRPPAGGGLELRTEALTAREIQVLQMLSEGVGNKAIARRLNISEHTVKFHISSLLSKMGAASRTEAVTEGIKNGLIVI
jgi:NarL family two-component system response regulator YdfI